LLLETSLVPAKSLKHPIDPEDREGDYARETEGIDQSEFRVAQDALPELQPLARE